MTETEKSKDTKDGQPEPDIGVQEKAEKDKLLDALMGAPVQKEEHAPETPSVGKTEKSPLSEPILEHPMSVEAWLRSSMDYLWRCATLLQSGCVRTA